MAVETRLAAHGAAASQGRYPHWTMSATGSSARHDLRLGPWRAAKSLGQRVLPRCDAALHSGGLIGDEVPTRNHLPEWKHSTSFGIALATSVIRAIDSPVRCGHNDHMVRNAVGARELKTRLGNYLQRVREGRTLVVTVRGEPVAELRPLPSDDSLPSALLKLSTRGAVTLPTTDGLSAFRPIRSRGASV